MRRSRVFKLPAALRSTGYPAASQDSSVTARDRVHFFAALLLVTFFCAKSSEESDRIITRYSQSHNLIWIIFSSFACPKEETRKRHPDCPGPAGSLALLASYGDAKKLGFASNIQRLNPPLPVMLSRPKGEIETKNSR